MKIVIPGGSGQVGTLLTRALLEEGHEVVILSRRPVEHAARVATWDGETAGPWTDEIDGADVVINLAGRSVNCRYHARNRRRILDSRIRSTRVIGEAITGCRRPPRVWLQAGTATIYAHRYDADNDETSGVIGGKESGAPDTWRFSIDVATAWEREVSQARTPRTRKVLLRSAMTMSPDRGGAFSAFFTLARWGLGGPAGSGRQYVSWVHELDFVRAVRWLIEHEDISGPVNIAAPAPLTNAEFMRAIRDAWGIGFGLPAKRWMLEFAAVFHRTETELLLKSRRVVSGRLCDNGFEFRFPNWPEAARELCGRWRQMYRARRPDRQTKPPMLEGQG